MEVRSPHPPLVLDRYPRCSLCEADMDVTPWPQVQPAVGDTAVIFVIYERRCSNCGAHVPPAQDPANQLRLAREVMRYAVPQPISLPLVRTALGLSQRAAADLLRIARATFAGWEKGRVDLPALARLGLTALLDEKLRQPTPASQILQEASCPPLPPPSIVIDHKDWL